MDTINKLFETPLPTLFILAGLFFLVLSVADKLGAKVIVNPKRQSQAILIGAVLIVIGIGFYLNIPADQKQGEDKVKTEQPSDNHIIYWGNKLMSIYSMENHKTFLIHSNHIKVHISCGGFFSPEAAGEGIKNTRFELRLNNKAIEPQTTVTYVKEDIRDEWHLEQFFLLSDLKKGNTYEVSGSTYRTSDDPVDSRTFFIRYE